MYEKPRLCSVCSGAPFAIPSHWQSFEWHALLPLKGNELVEMVACGGSLLEVQATLSGSAAPMIGAVLPGSSDGVALLEVSGNSAHHHEPALSLDC